MEQLFGIEMNDSLSLRGKERAMDSVISKNIDYSQRSKLQLPPIYGGLPAVAQWQIKDVFYHPNLTFDEKHAIIEKLIRDLPLDQQINIPQNNCSSETSKQKTMFFDSFSTIVYTIRYSVVSGFFAGIRDGEGFQSDRILRAISFIVSKPSLM